MDIGGELDRHLEVENANFWRDFALEGKRTDVISFHTKIRDRYGEL